MRWITRVILLPALISAQSIARTKWVGTGFQEFLADTGTCIKAFQATSPDAQGYVQLIAVSSTGQTGPIVRTRLQGVGVQDFTGTGCIAGFSVSPPDAEGYVTLYAHDMNNNQGPILRSRWEGIGFDSFTSPGEVIQGFSVSPPDAQGYVTLQVVTTPVSTGIEEKLKDAYESTITRLQVTRTQYLPDRIQLSLAVPGGENVTLTLFSALGRKVIESSQSFPEAGVYRINIPSKTLGPGIYFLRVRGKTGAYSKKMMVLH